MPLDVSATVSAATISSAAKTMLQIQNIANLLLSVYEVWIGFEGVAGTDDQALVELVRQTAKTSDSTAGNVRKLNDSISTSPQTTMRHTYTVEPTTGDILWADYVHMQNPKRWKVPKGLVKLAGGSTSAIGVRVTGTSGISSRKCAIACFYREGVLRYEVSHTITVPAATLRDVITITSPANRRSLVWRMSVSWNGDNASSKVNSQRIRRYTSAGTPNAGGNNPTVIKMDRMLNESIASTVKGAHQSTGWSSAPSQSTDLWMPFNMHSQNTWFWVAPDEEEAIALGGAEIFGIDVTNNQSAPMDVTVSMLVEE